MAGMVNTAVADAASNEAKDVSTSIVSAKDRASKGSLTMAWWGVCSAMFYIVVGVAMAKTYGSDASHPVVTMSMLGAALMMEGSHITKP